MDTTSPLPVGPCRILSLDGGGAKGFYSLGVLYELEAHLGGKPLCESFELVYGTSTGAIIAALVALGKPVAEIHRLYKEYVPSIMKGKSASSKARRLRDAAEAIFQELRFDAFKTRIGIVSTEWDLAKPKIFKNIAELGHGRPMTFQPGFGCTIAEAVQSSCSAYPVFARTTIKSELGDDILLGDGGYCANNPTLYAIADAINALKYRFEDLRVLNVGVGNYPPPQTPWWRELYSNVTSWPPLPFVRHWFTVKLLQKTLEINTASLDQLRAILFDGVDTIRINKSYSEPEMATDFTESDLRKLALLHKRGRESFGELEKDILKLVRT